MVPAVGEVQVALLVDVADVADGLPAAGVSRRRGLVGVVEVFEVEAALEVDLAGLTGRQLGAVFADDVHRTGQRTTDRARVGEPLVGGDQRRAVRFGGGVVLVDDRAPPVDHLLLDLHRARRRGMHDPLQARHVVALAYLGGEFEHAGEHHRDELAVGDAMFGDRIQGALGVELLHHHRGDAACLGLHRPHRGSGVIERCGTQVHRVGMHPERHQCGHQPRRLRRRHVRQLAFDAFGASGRARGVLQQIALDLVDDRGVRLVGHAFGVARPSLQGAVGDQQQRRQAVGQFVGQTRQGVGQLGRSDDRLRGAVVDDVCRLGRGQVRVDRHVVQARAAGGPHDRVHVGVVLHQDRDRVALDQPGLAEQVRQAVGPGLQFTEGHYGPGGIHDDGGLVGGGNGSVANLHAVRILRRT